MNYSSERTSDEYLQVNHCGIQDLRCGNHCRIRENGRIDYHILYIAEGACYAEIFGKEERVEEGGVILFKPHEKHQYRFFEKDSPVSCYIHFTGTGCEELLNDIGFETERVINIGKSKSVVAIFEKLEMESDMKRPYYEKYCVTYLMELFAAIGRRKTYGGNETYLKNKSKIDSVCQLMYDEYAQNNSLDRYAEYCHLSTSRFSHMFKAAMGITPLEYITSIRIDKAKELLANSDYTISEIADKTGFSSQNYFTRVFKKHVGVPPKEYLYK